mmetsp:Transcript_107737/g.300242  ORF Transcript_107737/g.300242 Transcript_107737/m.300242 type:complete len:215 (+) Transcript_107737:110-754(+)
MLRPPSAASGEGRPPSPRTSPRSTGSGGGAAGGGEKGGAIAAQCEVHKDAVVCNDAKVLGLGGVKIGQGTVLHPAAQVNAKVGPIVIGRYNVLEEQVEISNTVEEPLVIGDHNTFEVGAKVLGGGSSIGNANLFECRSQLGLGASVGDGCTLGVCASLPAGEHLPDETVIVGASGLRHKEGGAKEAHIQAVMKHIEVLKETLPRCHHLRKSAKP